MFAKDGVQTRHTSATGIADRSKTSEPNRKSGTAESDALERLRAGWRRRKRSSLAPSSELDFSWLGASEPIGNEAQPSRPASAPAFPTPTPPVLGATGPLNEGAVYICSGGDVKIKVYAIALYFDVKRSSQHSLKPECWIVEQGAISLRRHRAWFAIRRFTISSHFDLEA